MADGRIDPQAHYPYTETPAPRFALEVDRLSAAVVWSTLRAVDVAAWSSLTAVDDETGEEVWADRSEADSEARDRLIAALERAEEHQAGNGWTLLEMACELEQSRREAAARRLRDVAQAYGGPVPSSYEVAIPAYVLEVE